MKTYWVTFTRFDTDDTFHTEYSLKVVARDRRDARRKAHRMNSELGLPGARFISGFMADGLPSNA